MAEDLPHSVKAVYHSFQAIQALILSLATLVVKVIGVIYKIPLSNMIGTVGRGYFDSAYNLYVPIYTVSMAGLPVAIFFIYICSLVLIFSSRTSYRKSANSSPLCPFVIDP